MAVLSTLIRASLLASAAVAAPVAGLEFTASLRYRAPISRMVRREQDSVNSNYDGGGWILPVIIGGQEVALNIDTGSSDLWTASTLLSAQEQSLVQTEIGGMYDPSKSINYSVVQGASYGLGYADNSHSSGIVATDIVSIGGATVYKMAFGVCNSLALGNGQTSRDTNGPVGLGFGVMNSIRPSPQPTFMEALEPYVSKPVFCTKFRPNDNSSIDFGWIDETQYTGNLTTISIGNTTADLEGQWGTKAVSFGINGKQFDAAPVDLDFDSGTSSLSLPVDVANAYFAQVPGAKNSSNSWSYPCNTTLPDLDFMFSTSTAGPSTVSVPGKYIADQNSLTNVNCNTQVNVVTGRGSAGQAFFMSMYMIWNQKIPSLSFAAQVDA